MLDGGGQARRRSRRQEPLPQPPGPRREGIIADAIAAVAVAALAEEQLLPSLVKLVGVDVSREEGAEQTDQEEREEGGREGLNPTPASAGHRGWHGDWHESCQLAESRKANGDADCRLPTPTPTPMPMPMNHKD